MDITEEANIFVEGIQEQAIKMALQKAERAHHKFEQEILKGKRDDEWAAWYATFLKTNTEGAIFSDIEANILEMALKEATNEQVHHKEHSWEAFTANYIVHHLLPY